MPRSKQAVVEEFRIQSILEAALHVIARRGVAAATMQDVADEAEIAKGTIYLYFKSREDLVQGAAELAFSKLGAALEESLATSAPAPEVLRRLVEAKIAFFEAHREFFRAYMAACQGETAQGAAQGVKRRSYELHLRRLTEFLKQAMAAGELRSADPDRVALFLTEGMNAVIRRRLTEPEPPAPERDVALIATTLLEGLQLRL